MRAYAQVNPPVATSIIPISDTDLGGTSVTISGGNFQSGLTVTFGDSTATDIVVVSSDNITATSPAYPAGTVDVIVTNPNGLSDILSSGFTFVSHPDVTFINPSSGTELGGTIPLPLTERQIFRKLGFEKGGQGVEPRSERW